MIRAAVALMILGLALALVAALTACDVAAAAGSSEAARERDALRDRGRALFFGAAGCHACHSLDGEGGRVIGPDLGVGGDMTAPVAVRARTRRPELRPVEYVVESIAEPDAVVTPGYARGVMKSPLEPPLALGDDDVVALAVFLASRGPGAPPLGADDVAAARERLPLLRAGAP